MLYWLGAPGDRARLEQACRDLMAATWVHVGDEFAEQIEEAGQPTANAAYGLALALMGTKPDDKDLLDIARSWLWVAASTGHSRASLRLARELSAAVAAVNTTEDAMMRGQLATLWMDRSFLGGHADPTKDAGEPRRPRSFLRTYRDSQIDEAPEPDPVPLPTVDDQRRDQKPGIVVLRTIGGTKTNTGGALLKQYGDVEGVKLPLVGRLPLPGELHERFSALFPWAAGLARYLEGQMALLRSTGQRTPKLPPLLLVGPPGSGKTTMLEWLATFLELPSQTIALGGTSDAGGLAPVPRQWANSMPCAPFSLIAERKVANPVLILDELDKGVQGNAGQNGSAQGTLLTMLRPPTTGYHDTSLLANIDIRHVGFLASANNLSAVSQELRDRMVVQPVPAPSAEHFDAILPRIVDNRATALGVHPSLMPWMSSADTGWLRKGFASGCSIRRLERAYELLAGERAADENRAMMRPN